tara:strand:+ start:11310 stop:11705 length:396 start_codon:yes stop_codon:yes gene_type:complete
LTWKLRREVALDEISANQTVRLPILPRAGQFFAEGGASGELFEDEAPGLVAMTVRARFAQSLMGEHACWLQCVTPVGIVAIRTDFIADEFSTLDHGGLTCTGVTVEHEINPTNAIPKNDQIRMGIRKTTRM